LQPRVDESKNRRLIVPANSSADFQLIFPSPCDVRLITTRSDSAGEVMFTKLRHANISLIDGAIPVEFFFEGVSFKTFRAPASTRMQATLVNSGSEDRYVEIDVGIENAFKQGESAIR
jgi:hypothetical protein